MELVSDIEMQGVQLREDFWDEVDGCCLLGYVESVMKLLDSRQHNALLEELSFQSRAKCTIMEQVEAQVVKTGHVAQKYRKAGRRFRLPSTVLPPTQEVDFQVSE